MTLREAIGDWWRAKKFIVAEKAAYACLRASGRQPLALLLLEERAPPFGPRLELTGPLGVHCSRYPVAGELDRELDRLRCLLPASLLADGLTASASPDGWIPISRIDLRPGDAEIRHVSKGTA